MWMKDPRFSSKSELRMKPGLEIPVNPLRSLPSRMQPVRYYHIITNSRSCRCRNVLCSRTISVFPLSPGTPSPPLEVNIPDASREHINVSWKPPAKDGGCPVTGYHVEVAEARPELKWLRVNSRPIKELKFRIEDGIKPEKKYVIRVRAINSVGVSDPSEISDKVFTKDPDCKCKPVSVYYPITDKKPSITNPSSYPKVLQLWI